MATKEQRSVTIHDAFVNKLRNMTTQEYLETDRSFNASGQRQNCFGMETGLKFIFEQIALVARTVDSFFFEWIAQAVRTDSNFSNGQPKPFEWMAINFLEQMSEAIQMDDIFFSNRQPKLFERVTIFFLNRQPKPLKQIQ